MNVRTEFAIAAAAMAPLLVVSWAVTHQQQVAGSSFESATNTASATVSPVDDKRFDGPGVQVGTFDGATPSGFATSRQEGVAAGALAPQSGAARSADTSGSVRH